MNVLIYNIVNRLFLFFLLCLGFLPSCVLPQTPPPPPQKTFDTPKEYLQEAKYHFDVGKFRETLKYASKAIEMDSKNQSAHVLAGVAWAKLGKATNARNEFEAAIQIDSNTSDAAIALSWLEKLKNPLTVVIFPFQNLAQNRGNRSYRIERLSHEVLTKFLFESGLYSIVEERQLSHRRYRQGPVQSQACQNAGDKGVKIAIFGIISEFELVEDRPFISNANKRYYTAYLKVTFQLYATKDCQLIDTLTASGVTRQVPGRDVILQQVVDTVFEELALKIHATLM